VLRVYTDQHGKPVTQVGLGDELQVHLRFRALSGRSLADVALVDLLPGGFEVVDNGESRSVNAPVATSNEESEGGEGGESAEGATAWTPTFGAAVGSWSPDFAEVREDRVNVYGSAVASVREFVYTVKATAVGSFTVPPAYGEGMYDRTVRAWSEPARIVVVRPK
jgi:uncharacterized protein YfaS (alpha-2-macroglobulin family)